MSVILYQYSGLDLGLFFFVFGVSARKLEQMPWDGRLLSPAKIDFTVWPKRPCHELDSSNCPGGNDSKLAQIIEPLLHVGASLTQWGKLLIWMLTLATVLETMAEVIYKRARRWHLHDGNCHQWIKKDSSDRLYIKGTWTGNLCWYYCGECNEKRNIRWSKEEADNRCTMPTKNLKLYTPIISMLKKDAPVNTEGSSLEMVVRKNL